MKKAGEAQSHGIMSYKKFTQRLLND